MRLTRNHLNAEELNETDSPFFLTGVETVDALQGELVEYGAVLNKLDCHDLGGRYSVKERLIKRSVAFFGRAVAVVLLVWGPPTDTFRSCDIKIASWCSYYDSLCNTRTYGGYYYRRVPRVLRDVVSLTRYRGLHFSFLYLRQGESPPRWVTSVEKR